MFPGSEGPRIRWHEHSRPRPRLPHHICTVAAVARRRPRALRGHAVGPGGGRGGAGNTSAAVHGLDRHLLGLLCPNVHELHPPGMPNGPGCGDWVRVQKS